MEISLSQFVDFTFILIQKQAEVGWNKAED
jgi:hypothetical protein